MPLTVVLEHRKDMEIIGKIIANSEPLGVFSASQFKQLAEGCYPIAGKRRFKPGILWSHDRIPHYSMATRLPLLSETPQWNYSCPSLSK